MEENVTYRRFRFRLYPKPAQEEYFRRMFSCCRIVYNHFLEIRIAAYEARRRGELERVPTRFDMCRMLTTFKKERTDKDGRHFLSDVDSTALVYELQHLDDAFRRFFQRVKAGSSKAGYPRFKGRGDRESATVTFKKTENVERNRMRFAKVGWVNAKCWRPLEGEPVCCTVSADAAGRWWASVLCKNVPAPCIDKPTCDQAVVGVVSAVRADAAYADEPRVDKVCASASCADKARADAAHAAKQSGGTLPLGSPEYTGREISRSLGEPSDNDPSSCGDVAGFANIATVNVADDDLERRIRREEKRLLRREGTFQGKKSKRYRKQQQKIARLRAKGTDRLRTQVGQVAASAVKSASTVVFEAPEQPTHESRELERQLRYKCEVYGRKLVVERTAGTVAKGT